MGKFRLLTGLFILNRSCIIGSRVWHHNIEVLLEQCSVFENGLK